MPKVTINITATDDASSVLRKVTKEMEGLDSSTKKTNSSMLTNSLTLGASATALYKLGATALKASGEMEQNEIAFKTMLGSGDKAKTLLQDMTTFAEKTPFELPGVVNAGKQMIAFGFQSNEIINNLKMLGDVSAGLSVPIGDMTYLFGQIKTQGKAMTQDLMQFANRGVPIFEELAKVTGKNTSQIRDMASKGKIGFDEINQAFKNMTGEGSKFGGLMEAQSASLLGKWSNFNDALGKTFVLMGRDMTPTAKALLDTLNKIVAYDNQMVDKAQRLKEAEVDRLKANGSIATAYITQNGYLATALNLMNGNAEAELRMEALQQKKNEYLKIQKAHQAGAITLSGEQLTILQKSIDEVERMEKALKGQGQSFSKMYEPAIKLAEEYQKKFKQNQDKDYGSGNDRKQKDALKFYDDLVLKSAMAEASDIRRIDLTTQKELKSLEDKKAYLTEYQYQEAKSLITYDALKEADQARLKQTSKMFEDMSSIQTKFYTDTVSEEANAIGNMSREITSALQTMSGEIGKVFADIASDSKKNGITMGDGFKIGASVAVSALSSINAVLNMQSALVQASYQRQIEALQYKQEKELELLEESYDLLEEDSDNKEELRLLELQAYAESLQGKTDAEIDYALKKKETELRSANDEKNIDTKKEAEKKKVDQKYAKEKWKLEVEAFKSKQEADKSAVMMATAIGVVQAWAGAMSLSPVIPAVVAVGTALSAIMIGTAVKQVSMISDQKAPAPPAFATGVTNFEGGWALVGERGREMVNLPKGTNVITNENTEKLLGGGSSPQYLVNNIYVNGVLTQQEIVDLRKASAYGGY